MTLLETPQIEALIESKDWRTLREALADIPTWQVAEILFELEAADRLVLFRLLPQEAASDVFSYLEPEQQNELLDELTSEEMRGLLAALSPDDRTQLFEELPGRLTQKLLNLLNPQDLAETRRLLGYPPQSVGRLMTPDYIAVRPEWTIGEALEHVRKRGGESETLNVLYVTDRNWKLLDALALPRFILADPSLKVADIMDYAFVSLSAFEDREQAVRTMERSDLEVLPVVDSQGVLVGIVTFDDVLDVAEAEATEDFHKTAGVTPLRSSYRATGFWQLYRKRISWLVVLVFANIFSGTAIATFEETIAANIALVFFLPLLIDSSGNAGSQAATLMVRALATGDVKLNDWGRLLVKEVGIAAALGFTMSLAVFGIGFIRAGVEIALVVSLTMSLVVVVGSIIGTALPFLLSRFRMDPATASAPLITSMSDISGVIIYFSLATWLLNL